MEFVYHLLPWKNMFSNITVEKDLEQKNRSSVRLVVFTVDKPARVILL
jgi:hypothetical protein